MSKAQPSDGKINQLFLTMTVKGFSTYGQTDVDTVLTESKLKQCKYETLIAIQNAYILAFKNKSWPVHGQIIIKAEQSSIWRAWRDANQSNSGVIASTAYVDTDSDPLVELMA